jgi:hypothetical protein
MDFFLPFVHARKPIVTEVFASSTRHAEFSVLSLSLYPYPLFQWFIKKSLNVATTAQTILKSLPMEERFQVTDYREHKVSGATNTKTRHSP